MPRFSTTAPRRPSRTLAAPVSLLLAAALSTAAPAQAAPPAGWTEIGWSACADAEAQYCVEQATVTPPEGVPTPVADLGLAVSATPLPGDVTSFNWAVTGWETAQPQALGGDVTLVIRTGQFVPRYTMALASGMRVARVTDEETGNSTLTITGRAIGIDWTTGPLFAPCGAGTDCGGPDTMADAPGQPGSGYRFSGNTQDLGTWEGDVETLDGMYFASDAQARPPTIVFGTSPEPYWYLPFLGNPHLDSAGNPVRGSFNAWLPEAYFASLGSSADAAAGVGFDVLSTEGGVQVSIPAQVTARDGGVGIDVKDLGYSVHRIDVLSRPSQVDAQAGAPGPPRYVAVAPTVGAVAVSWATPTSDGGSPVTGYTARAFTAPTGGTVAGRCTSTTTSCTISGLVDGTSYFIAASASNALGEGRAAGTRRGTVIGATPPTAASAVRLTAGPNRLVTTWTAPASTGGAAVTGYTVRAYRAATGGSPVATCGATAGARSCALTGLTNGTTYHVAVLASNAAGPGPESAPRVAAVPRTTPTAPRTVSATSGGGRVRVTWSAPATTGGSAVTGYRVTAYLTGTGTAVAGRCAGTGAARTCTTPALTVGRSYHVSVTAVNAAGVSTASPRVRVLVRR
ncbi:MAG TPA: fibronectin type III domain-containing protein [Catenuloplanes sp.]|jgi:hypothetical protein